MREGIRFCCTNCGQKIRVATIHAGKKGRCPRCRTMLAVPAAHTIPTVQENAPVENIKSPPSPKPLYTNLSFWTLLASNVIVMIWAVRGNWPLINLMWAYWVQNIIIGLMWAVKIVSVEDFSIQSLGINVSLRYKTESSDSRFAKYLLATIFLLHYGFLHFGYAKFLASETDVSLSVPIVAASLIFVANHVFSFFYNRKRDIVSRPDLVLMLLFPYARVIPMHLAVFLADLTSGTIPLFVFLVLKTIADVVMDAIERRQFAYKSSEEIAAEGKKYAQIARPPRTIPLSVLLLVLFGNDISRNSWRVMIYAVPLALVLLGAAHVHNVLFLIAGAGLCFVLIGMFTSFRYIGLLRNGSIGPAKVIGSDMYKNFLREGYEVTYEFVADDGRTYQAKARAANAALLTDEPYETVLYHCENPAQAVMLDWLPGRLIPDGAGGIKIGSTLHALLALLPLTAILVIFYTGLLLIK